MLVVHHLGVSQSERIVWLCEELEIPYRLERYERNPVTRFAPPEYKAIHPFGTSPVITDNGRAIGESSAIIEYIIHRYGNGRLAVTPDHPSYADYLHWYHFANGSFMPAYTIQILMLMMNGTVEQARAVDSLRERIDKAFAMVESRLGEANYFAGDEFTAADILMFFPMSTMRLYVPRDLSGAPNTQAYLKRIGARPAYQRALQKCDPDMSPMLE